MAARGKGSTGPKPVTKKTNFEFRPMDPPVPEGHRFEGTAIPEPPIGRGGHCLYVDGWLWGTVRQHADGIEVLFHGGAAPSIPWERGDGAVYPTAMEAVLAHRLPDVAP
jgi:hypothetical protein